MTSIFRSPLVWIFLVALVARAAFVLIIRPDPFGMVDSREYDLAARHLLAGGGFSDGLGFVRPPLYPALVALSYALGGLAVLQGIQIVLGATTVVLIGLLARELRPAPGVDLAAAGLAVVYPWFFQFVGGLASETLFTFLAVGAFFAVVRASHLHRPAATLFAGLAFGLATLARTNLLTAAPFIFGWLFWRSRTLVHPAAFLLALVLTLAPFTIYNFAAGNGLVIGSTGGGSSFAVANNPEAALLYSGTLSDDEWRQINANAGRTKYALEWFGCRYVDDWRQLCAEKVSLPQRESFFYQQGLRYIRTHTDEWLMLELRKFLHYWRPWVEPRAYPPIVVVASGISFTTILILAVLGIRRMARAESMFVLLVALSATLTVMIWAVQLRYRFALLDPVLIAAGGAPTAALIAGLVKASPLRALRLVLPR